jgi:general secretion pathway protein N
MPFRGNPLWTVPLQELSATNERPIFTPARRPAQPPAVTMDQPTIGAKPAPTPPDTPHLTLLGTVTAGDGAKGIGIFRDEIEKRALGLRLGEHHHGWAVRGVQRTSVTLEKDGESVVLTLAPDTANPAPPAVSPALPQPAAERPPVARRLEAPASMPVAAFDWSAILKQGESGSSP